MFLAVVSDMKPDMYVASAVARYVENGTAPPPPTTPHPQHIKGDIMQQNDLNQNVINSDMPRRQAVSGSRCRSIMSTELALLTRSSFLSPVPAHPTSLPFDSILEHAFTVINGHDQASARANARHCGNSNQGPCGLIDDYGPYMALDPLLPRNVKTELTVLMIRWSQNKRGNGRRGHPNPS
ncbi:hypothetical protein ACOMHN_003356 [Nucella lapillus]